MSSAKRVAYAGLGTALSLIFVYLSSILPVNNLTLLAVAGFAPAAVLILSGYANAWRSFVAASLLCWMLVPQKQYVLMYIIFFGWYGIAKCYLEFNLQMVLQWLSKLAVFNIAAWILYNAASAFWTADISNKFPLLLIWFGANLVFIAYDIAFGLAASYLQKRIGKR